MARKNAVVTYVRNEDGTLTFNAGEQSFSMNPAELSEEVNLKARDYGLTHKVTLGAAIAKEDLPTDPVEAAAAKFAGMKAVADRIVAGEWSMRGQGGGQASGVIYRAFEEYALAQAAKKGVEAPAVERIREVYDAKTRAEQLALRNVPAIGKIIERLKSEGGSKASTSVDTGALLGELGI